MVDFVNKAMKSLGFIKPWEILDHLSQYDLPKEEAALWS
jgi:hypothetical protein